MQSLRGPDFAPGHDPRALGSVRVVLDRDTIIFTSPGRADIAVVKVGLDGGKVALGGRPVAAAAGGTKVDDGAFREMDRRRLRIEDLARAIGKLDPELRLRGRQTAENPIGCEFCPIRGQRDGGVVIEPELTQNAGAAARAPGTAAVLG